MEITINKMWKKVFDKNNIGEENEWYLPHNYPKYFTPYTVPAFFWDKPFEGTKYAWLKREFDFSANNGSFVYLVFFMADKGKVWLNGEFIGGLKRSVGKQYFDITNIVSNKNTLIIKLEDLEDISLGLSKYVYVLENTTIPRIAKKTVDHSPKWVDQSVIYSIFTRNFTKAGDFQSLTKKLKDIKKTGCNTLWLLPIHPIGETERKGQLGSPYAIKDYYAINPEYGSLNDFKALVKEAHSLDMKVVLDLVINHTAIDSVLKNIDPNFYKPPNDQSASKWGWTDVEELNYDYAPTREYIKEMMAYWIREFDIDGYRCDVAFLVPCDFWSEAISYIRSIKKDILMLAEADNPELYEYGFDLTYDWMYWVLLQYIDAGYYKFSEIYEYILSQNEYFPQNSKRLIFLENHDTPRAARTFSKKTLLPFQLIKYFTPGVPLIYNGEEVISQDTPNLFKKDTIIWKSKKNEIYRFNKKIFNLKTNQTALNYFYKDGFELYKERKFTRIIRRDLKQIIEAVFENDTLDVKIYIDGNKSIEMPNKLKVY